MKEKINKLNLPDIQVGNEETNDLQGYPIYPDSEDIYRKFREEEDINPEDISKTKESKIK